MRNRRFLPYAPGLPSIYVRPCSRRVLSGDPRFVNPFIHDLPGLPSLAQGCYMITARMECPPSKKFFFGSCLLVPPGPVLHVRPREREAQETPRATRFSIHTAPRSYAHICPTYHMFPAASGGLRLIYLASLQIAGLSMLRPVPRQLPRYYEAPCRVRGEEKGGKGSDWSSVHATYSNASQGLALD